MTKLVTPTFGNLPDLDSDFTNQMRAFINAKVRDHMRSGGSLMLLLHKCNGQIKTTQTLSRLAYYETTAPKWRTVWAVVEALDLEEQIGNMMIAYGRTKHGRPTSGTVKK